MKNLLIILFVGVGAVGCGDEPKINNEVINCETASKAEILELMEVFISENVDSNQVIVRVPIEDLNPGLGGNYVLDNLRMNHELIDSSDIICMNAQSSSPFKLDWKEVGVNHFFISMDDFKSHGNFNHYLNDTLGARGFCFISTPYFNKDKDVAVIGIDLNHKFEQSSGFIIFYKKKNNKWKRVHYYQHSMS